MGPAVIGLLGVIIGALLSGTATFIMARRAEARVTSLEMVYEMATSRPVSI
jgi:hypothetical protein